MGKIVTCEIYGLAKNFRGALYFVGREARKAHSRHPWGASDTPHQAGPVPGNWFWRISNCLAKSLPWKYSHICIEWSFHTMCGHSNRKDKQLGLPRTDFRTCLRLLATSMLVSHRLCVPAQAQSTVCPEGVLGLSQCGPELSV